MKPLIYASKLVKTPLFLLVIFCITLNSCSLDDGTNTNFYTEFIPVDSVDFPDTFVQGQTHQIHVTYTKPSNCYVFNNIVLNVDGHQRTVVVVNTVYPEGNCQPNPQQNTVSFDFYAGSSETYVFKFYQGTNTSGEDQYLIVEVPVE